MIAMRDDRKAWDALQARMRAAGGFLVKVGYIEGQSADEGHGGISNVDLATLHEFGSPGGKLPERSFLRATWDATTSERDRKVEQFTRAIIDGKMDAERALGQLGAWFAGRVKSFIASGQVQPPSQKGSGVTLVDTGQLMNGVTWAVEKS